LGVNYRDAGRPAEGARRIEDALRRARGRPDAVAGLAWAASALALTYESLGRWADAEPLRRAALARRRTATKPDSPLLAGDLAALGANLLNQAKWSEAEPILRECLAIREKVIPDDWSRFSAMGLLGGALLGRGRYAEAEPLVVTGYEGMKSRASRSSARWQFSPLPVAAERVVRLYEAWGKPEKARVWAEKLGLADLPKDVFARP